MAKKPKYTPPPYGYYDNPKGTFSGIYASQLQSPAFQALTDKQKILYIYMRMQEHTSNRPPAEFGNYTFYFPKSLWSERLKLYDHGERYYRDVDALIDHGFIDCVSSGFLTKEKNVYRMSDRWKNYGKELFTTPTSAKRMHTGRRR